MTRNRYRALTARLLNAVTIGLFALFLLSLVANLLSVLVGIAPAVTWAGVVKLFLLGMLSTLVKLVIDPGEDVVWPGTSEGQ